MLRQVASSVWVHTSEFLQSNAVVVQGTAGVLLIDPGITVDEMAVLAKDIRELGQAVVAGFSTHPHWDHLLWRAEFGAVPRYGTARAAVEIHDFFSNADWRSQAMQMLPTDIAADIPIDDMFGQTTALPVGTTELPWDGPKVRIVEHGGHAAGSAALWIEESGVLIAGDMLSDILIPFLEFDSANPSVDYLAALDLLESLADETKVLIPGHGTVGDTDDLRARIQYDRMYIQALLDGSNIDDPRLTASPSKEVHAWQSQQISDKEKHA